MKTLKTEQKFLKPPPSLKKAKLSDIVKKVHIAYAARLGACSTAIKWLRAEPRTWRQAVDRHGKWMLQYAAHLLQPEILDKCAERWPRTALCCAAEYLSPEILDWCAGRHPSDALRYAADHLSPERRQWCAARMR